MGEELERIEVIVTRIISPAEFWVKRRPENQNRKQENQNARNQTQSTNHIRPESLAKGIFHHE